MNSLPLDLTGAIGWTRSEIRKTEDFVENDPIFQGTIPGVEGSLYRITHEAGRRVLQNAGRRQDEIEATLTNRHIYAFELKAATTMGKPFLVEEWTPEGMTVTAAVYQISVLLRVDRLFYFYFEVEKTVNVTGQLGQMGDTLQDIQTASHPLRTLHSQKIHDLEESWLAAKLGEDNSSAGTPDRRAHFKARQDASKTLAETHLEILKPYFKSEFKDH